MPRSGCSALHGVNTNIKNQKESFFLKIIRIIVKDSMGQTVLSFDQKTCFDQKTKMLLCFLTKILLKDKSAEPDQIKLALL